MRTAHAPLMLLACLGVALIARGAAGAEPPVTALAFAPDGRAVVAGSQAGIAVRAWPGLEPLAALPTGLANVHDLAFSPGGDVLAAAGGTPSEAGEVELLRWPGGEKQRGGVVGDDLVFAIAWRGDGRGWATASLDHIVRVHRPDGTEVRALEGHSRGVLDLVYLPDGKTLVTAGLDHSVRVWDVDGGRCVRRLDHHTGPVHALALRPAGPPGSPAMVASAGADRTVRLWQPTVGRMVRLARLASPPLDLAWTPDGRSVAAACADGHVRVIDPDTVSVVGDLLALDGRAHALAASPDGSALVVGGQDGRIRRVALDPP